jgi:type II secretory pathway component PulK
LRPYATVHPVVRGDGVNPNTARSYVLATLYYGTSGDLRMADEDVVRDLLDIRARGGILCSDEADDERCTPIRDAVPGEIIPPPTWTSDVFTVTAEATYGSVQRTVEAVIDRSDVTDPRTLAWKVR